MGVIIPARGPGEAVRNALEWSHTRSLSWTGRGSSNTGKRQLNWDPPRPPPLSQFEDFTTTTAALPEPSGAREPITNGQRCGFYAGIASLAVSPVIIVLAVLYFVRRRRALQRQRNPDVMEPRDSLHPYELDSATEAGVAEDQDLKHVLQGSRGEKAATQDVSEDARQSSASSLDDPEKLATLRRVMKQAGFTVDAMVAGLNRIARSSSFGGALYRTPTNPPPVYER